MTFSYDRESQPALHNVSLTIEKGEYVCIIGHNGSGKSTLSRLLNGLILPEEGQVEVEGILTTDPVGIWEIRRTVGMVFQNPDNQFVAPTVEDDIAFGLENAGVDPDEMEGRIVEALDRVDMLPFRQAEPSRLSGGQKQRVAIAGMLALHPKVLVLDEATAMLDPIGRREVLDVVGRMNREEGMTVIHITHYLEETLNCDRILVMVQGTVATQGAPGEIYQNPAYLRSLRLDVPFAVDLYERLKQRGLAGGPFPLTVEEVISSIWISN